MVFKINFHLQFTGRNTHIWKYYRHKVLSHADVISDKKSFLSIVGRRHNEFKDHLANSVSSCELALASVVSIQVDNHFTFVSWLALNYFNFVAKNQLYNSNNTKCHIECSPMEKSRYLNKSDKSNLGSVLRISRYPCNLFHLKSLFLWWCVLGNRWIHHLDLWHSNYWN